MAIEDINDDSRAIGNRLGLDPIRKQSLVMAGSASPKPQLPFTNPTGNPFRPPVQAFTTGVPPTVPQPPVAPSPFSVPTTKGKVFPTSQSPDMPYDSSFIPLRKYLVKLAWKEFNHWNAKGAQLHIPDGGNADRETALRKYWKDVAQIFQGERNNEDMFYDSLVNRGDYKNWGAAFISYLISESLKNSPAVDARKVEKFTYRNSYNIYLSARNTFFYILREKLNNFLTMLQNNTAYNPPYVSNAIAQRTTFKRFLRFRGFDKRPLFFHKKFMKDGTVLCEPGDILCLKDNAAERDVTTQILKAAKLPAYVTSMKELKVHYDCEVIVYSVYNSNTNKIIIRTIGGNIQNSVKSKLYVFDIKADPSTGGNYYDLRSNLILGIIKFPSSMASFTYPVI